MLLPFQPAFPWLLYAYPWMPFPRRVIIYLREKRIPASLVQVVHVSDPGEGNQVVESASFPPRPSGSLPILAIPSFEKDEAGKPDSWMYVRQSMAIISLVEEVCEKGEYRFSSLRGIITGTDAIQRARILEIQTLAEELTVGWNPVRSFGTGAGPFHHAAAAREMLRWERRTLLAINTYMEESDRDVSLLNNNDAQATMADIVLYQFLEFTLDCYGVDMTAGSGEKVVDVYGREVVDAYPKLQEFFKAFRARDSAKRLEDQGELPKGKVLEAMRTWEEGVL